MDSDLYLYLKNIHRRISFLFFFDNSTARSLRSLSLPRPHPLVLAVNKSTANFTSKRTQDPMISKEKIQRLYTKTLVKAKPQRQTSEDPPDV